MKKKQKEERQIELVRRSKRDDDGRTCSLPYRTHPSGSAAATQTQTEKESE